MRQEARRSRCPPPPPPPGMRLRTPDGDLHQRAKARLHRRDGGCPGTVTPPRRARSRHTRARRAFRRARTGCRRPAHVPGRSSIPASPCTHTSSGAVQRIAAPATMSSLIAAVMKVPPGELVSHHPGHDDVVLEGARACEATPPTFISTSSATTTRPWPVCSSERPVNLDIVAARDDVAVVVRGADLGAVELAGVRWAPRAAYWSIDSARQLERMQPLRRHPAGVKGRSSGKLLGLGRVEKPKQRRPGGRRRPPSSSSAPKSSEFARKPSSCSSASPGRRSSSLAVAGPCPPRSRPGTSRARSARGRGLDSSRERIVTRTRLRLRRCRARRGLTRECAARTFSLESTRRLSEISALRERSGNRTRVRDCRLSMARCAPPPGVYVPRPPSPPCLIRRPGSSGCKCVADSPAQGNRPRVIGNHPTEGEHPNQSQTRTLVRKPSDWRSQPCDGW